MILGTGKFTWDSAERRTNRYGSFTLVDGVEIFDSTIFLNKMVKISCEVLETRKSSHMGDIFLGIYPSTPKVGDVIELGTGIFDIQNSTWNEECPDFFLKNEERRELWIDPVQLYKVHDQTVRVLICCAVKPPALAVGI